MGWVEEGKSYDPPRRDREQRILYRRYEEYEGYGIEEATKRVREKFCATLQHSLETMRKDHKRLKREALESMRDRYKDKISALKEEHGMQRLREVM